MTNNVTTLRALIINNCNVNSDAMEKILRGLHVNLTNANYKYPTLKVALCFLRILLLSGADLYEHMIHGYTKQLHLYAIGQNDPRCKIIEWLNNWFKKPHSLRFFCRKTLRNTYRKKLSIIMRKIEYPKRLKDYILTVTL